MTFNNETNIALGNKHNNEQQQQQHDHRTGRIKLFCLLLFQKFNVKSFPEDKKEINVNIIYILI
jgi:hypothetical protein